MLIEGLKLDLRDFHGDGPGARFGDAGLVIVENAHLLFAGEFTRSGRDLIISDSEHRQVIPGYFAHSKHPLLVTLEGASLDPKTVGYLTGYTAYAQASGGSTAKVVGHVVKMTGSASIIRNGVTIVTNEGDVVYQSDVVQTGSNSTLGLVLEDGTTFNLSAGARFILNELTFDATSTSNSSLMTLVQGAASFVAGQVARSGDMKVATPTATMGIRGTAVILDISSSDGKVSISVIDQHDGQVHAVQVFNPQGVLVGTVFSNGSTITLTPTATFEVLAQEINKTAAQVQQEFAAFQQVLSTYDSAKQLFPDLPQHTENTNHDNNASPNTTTRLAGSPSLNAPGTEYHSPETILSAGQNGPVSTTVIFTTNNPSDPSLSFQQTLLLDAASVKTTSIPFLVLPASLSAITSSSGNHVGPVMSAAGDVVYDPDGAIYFYDRESNATTLLASPSGGWIYGSPTISSNGKYIAYQGTKDGTTYVFVYGLDAADAAHYHTQTKVGPGKLPSLNGDGQLLAAEQSAGNVILYDISGNVLTSIMPAAAGNAEALFRPAISADGRIIAFWAADAASGGDSGRLYALDRSTGSLIELAQSASGAGISAPSLSADGHLVAYESTDTNGHSEIYMYDLVLGRAVFHTGNLTGNSASPVISPDGHYIAFASYAALTTEDQNATIDAYVVDVANPSSPTYKLISRGHGGDGGIAISAGGQYVAFGSGGVIFFADSSSGLGALIFETEASPPVLSAHGTLSLTGNYDGVLVTTTDVAGNPTSLFQAVLDATGHLNWQFSEAHNDFASLAYGQRATQEFFIKLSADNGALKIPVLITVYDGIQPSITVVDAPPLASPVVLPVGQEDEPYTISSSELLKAVIDVDGPLLTIAGLSILDGAGQLDDNHNGSWTYTPDRNYNGLVTLSYSVSDGTLRSSSLASFELASVDDAPVATEVILANGAEDLDYTISSADLLAGVSDVDSTSLSIVGLSIRSGGGRLIDNHDGTWTYSPAANYNGLVGFDYVASDGTKTSSAVASLRLASVNDPASIDGTLSGSVIEDIRTSVSGQLIVSDVDTNEAVFSPVSSHVLIGTYGNFSFDAASGVWSYLLSHEKVDSLAAGQTSYDQLNVTSYDGSASAVISVTITGTNDTPIVLSSTTASGTISLTTGNETADNHTGGAATILAHDPGLIAGLSGSAGYGDVALSPGDDNSSAAIDITPVFGQQGINFFGSYYTSLYINNNGNITFTGPSSTYTPSQINAGFGNPIIAPFWADVDTRRAGHVYYDLDATDGVMTVTWDKVGYFDRHDDKLNSFQIVLVDEGSGDFDIFYRYAGITWTTGDFSDGQPARAGYSSGDGSHYYELPESGDVSELLALPTKPGNTGVIGLDQFKVRNGEVGPATVSAAGSIDFSDPDLLDSHAATVSFDGNGNALGTLTLQEVSDTTGTGTGGKFNWTYTAPASDVEEALSGDVDHMRVETFTVVISDGHDGTVSQKISVTLQGSTSDESATLGTIADNLPALASDDGARLSAVPELTDAAVRAPNSIGFVFSPFTSPPSRSSNGSPSAIFPEGYPDMVFGNMARDQFKFAASDLVEANAQHAMMNLAAETNDLSSLVMASRSDNIFAQHTALPLDLDAHTALQLHHFLAGPLSGGDFIVSPHSIGG